MKPWIKYLRIITNLVFFLIAVFLITFVVPKVLGFFMPFLIGWIIAWIANPLVKFLEKHLKIVRKFGSFIIVVSVLAVVSFGGYVIISQTMEQALGLIDKIPVTYEKVMVEVSEIVKHLDVILRRLPESVQSGLDSFRESSVTMINDWAKNLGRPAVEMASRMAKNIPFVFVSVIITIVSAYFFIADREKLILSCKKVAPVSLQRTATIVKDSFSSTVGGYFKAQFKIMGVVALILLAGFFVLKVDYAILLAVLIAFLDMLPFLGTGTVLFPWAAYKILIQDYRMALGLMILYAITQVIRQVIQPKLIGDSVGLAPLPTLFLLYIGYRLGGFLGMLVAIPLGMTLIHLYRRGVFNNVIEDLKEIVDDINRFRRRP